MASILKLRASRIRQAIAAFGVDAIGLEGMRWPMQAMEMKDHEDDPIRAMLPDFLNSRAYTIFGGTAEVQLDIIARTYCLTAS